MGERGGGVDERMDAGMSRWMKGCTGGEHVNEWESE